MRFVVKVYFGTTTTDMYICKLYRSQPSYCYAIVGDCRQNTFGARGKYIVQRVQEQLHTLYNSISQIMEILVAVNEQ